MKRVFTYVLDIAAFLALNRGFKPLANWAGRRVLDMLVRPEDHRDAAR